MSDHKKFKNESQDARRRDQHNATHPGEKSGHSKDKSLKDKHPHKSK